MTIPEFLEKWGKDMSYECLLDLQQTFIDEGKKIIRDGFDAGVKFMEERKSS